ncbi:restriction endonuclease [Catenovulum agarivorans]|uniref:restriction endonuclease n=1 Tax=Catenovulum agarivorans TaxID=1172192 RepID=UPI00037D51EB|nr:restriction endonuclease [Catenovulum agarivorans]
MNTEWKSYEEVSSYLLGTIKDKLELTCVEGKQKLVGKKSGTEWEIDAKGVKEGGGGIVIIECRRYTTSKQNQEKIAGLAYRIHDMGASGGIIVSPLGIQSGAEKVAAAEKILSVEISANSTPENFTMRFLNQIFVGVSMNSVSSSTMSATVLRTCCVCGSRFEVKENEKSCARCAQPTTQ